MSLRHRRRLGYSPAGPRSLGPLATGRAIWPCPLQTRAKLPGATPRAAGAQRGEAARGCPGSSQPGGPAGAPRGLALRPGSRQWGGLSHRDRSSSPAAAAPQASAGPSAASGAPPAGSAGPSAASGAPSAASGAPRASAAPPAASAGHPPAQQLLLDPVASFGPGPPGPATAPQASTGPRSGWVGPHEPCHSVSLIRIPLWGSWTWATLIFRPRCFGESSHRCKS